MVKLTLKIKEFLEGKHFGKLHARSSQKG